MKFCILPICFFLFGCANQTVNISNIAASAGVTTRDLRPATEKENKTFSLNISNDAYAIYRRGDALLDPPAPRLLQHRVFEKLSQSTSSLDLTIHHLVVYWNAQLQFRNSARAAAVNAFGGVVTLDAQSNATNPTTSLVDRTKFESLANEEYKRAIFAEAASGEAGLLIVYLDAEINGKRFFVKSLHPIVKADGKNSHGIALESAISYFLSLY
ncbi:MAG: hypothetical protein QM808_00845 [Steroidobacteraceae bacterium]